tara:strand:+ start:31510 stop:31698 length:189 start_codon:yes stop_codon:yes gene_type:complete
VHYLSEFLPSSWNFEELTLVVFIGQNDKSSMTALGFCNFRRLIVSVKAIKFKNYSILIYIKY